jgi:eukaryotic-like serine/threonine-protein kinase
MDAIGLFYREVSHADARRTAILCHVMNLPAVHSGGALRRAPRPPAESGRGNGRRSGVSFRPWQLTRLLRRGERMDVFRAGLAENDFGPGCYVVKGPRREGDSIAAAMLRREQLVAGEVMHPNLVSALALAGEGHDFLVLPYLEGVTLRRWLAHAAARHSRCLPVPRALAITRQIASALDTLHQAGWLHGQVRPEHVIVSPQGHATLIDLTSARRLESSECDSGGDVAMSPVYAAPECSLSRGRVTAAADTYALGIMLYELLTGRQPFVARDARQLVSLHCRAAPAELRQLRPEASLECSQLVRRMLAKEPLRRPSDEELVRWLAEIEIAQL